MTEPTPKDEKKQAAAKPRPKRAQVVSFRFRDETTGRQLDGVGVVSRSDDDGAVAIRPLADFDVWVDPADVELVATVDD